MPDMSYLFGGSRWLADAYNTCRQLCRMSFSPSYNVAVYIAMTFVFHFTPEHTRKQIKQRDGKLPLDDFSSLPSLFSIISNFGTFWGSTMSESATNSQR